MKWSWKTFWVSLFLLIGIAATYVIIKGYGLKSIFSFYSHFNIWLLLLYLLVIIIIHSILTWRWTAILKSRGHHVPFFKLYMYRLIGFSINLFTPGPRVGGEPTQASLLGKHKIEFTEGLSTIVIDKIIDVSTNGILFIVGAVLVGLRYALPHKAGELMTAGALVFLALIVIFYYQMLNDRHFFLHIFRFLRLDRTKNKTLKKIEQKIEEIELIMIQFYKHDKKTFMITIGITMLSWVAMFFEYKLATTLLGLNLGPVEIFFIITFIGIAVLFPVPMAVGVLEAGQISAFSMINIAGGAGVALAFLVRMKDVFWGIIGILLLAVFGFDIGVTIKKKYNNKTEGAKNA